MQEACWYEQIYVVQEPVRQGKNPDVTLYVDYKGKTKVGSQKITYKQNSIELIEAIKTAYEYAYNRFILKV